jgi:hypothetical protein
VRSVTVRGDDETLPTKMRERDTKTELGSHRNRPRKRHSTKIMVVII